MTDLLSTFQKSSKDEALALISRTPETLQTLLSSYQTFFPEQSVTETTKAFVDKQESNEAAEQAVASTLDAVDHVLGVYGKLSRYIQLTMPMVEDGGNFGVTVQLAGMKLITDQTEILKKNLEEIYKYHATRADAMEKLKLPSSSTTKSTTANASESSGKDSEKGDTNSSSNSQSTETKSVETSNTFVEVELRKKALLDVDLKYYNLAKSTYRDAITGFVVVVDFMDKNKVKLDKPKGDSGPRGYSSSMY